MVFALMLAQPLAAAEAPPPGMVVTRVVPDGPAAKAGVHVGDVLIACDNVPLVYLSSLTQAINKRRAPNKASVCLQVRRGDALMTVTLAAAKEFGMTLVPPLPRAAQTLYDESVALPAEAHKDRAAKLTGAAEAAEAANDARAAAYLWLLVYLNLSQSSLEARKAAERATAQAAAAYDSLSEAAGWERQGITARAHGDQDAARQCFQRVLAIRERLLPDSLDVACCLNNLGGVAHLQGDLSAARDYYQGALAIQERIAPDSLDVAMTLGNLGGLACQRGDFQSGRNYFERALPIWERLSPDSTDMARILSSLGVVSHDQGNFVQAKVHLARALALYERLSPGSMDSATVLNNLGNVCVKSGDVKGARGHYQRALAIEEVVARDSLPVAYSLTGLGIAAYDAGEVTAAGDFHRRALTIYERLAPESQGASQNLSALAVIAVQKGDMSSAREYKRRALSVDEHLFPDSLVLAAGLGMMGGMLAAQGHLKAAREHSERALTIWEKLRPDSMELVMALNALGIIARAQRDFGASRRYYERALAIQEHIAPQTESTAENLRSLGDVFRDEGDVKTARDCFQRSLLVLQKVASQSLSVATILDELGDVSNEEGDSKGACQFYQEALEMRQRLGPDSLAVATSLNNLGNVRCAEGHYGAAREDYLRALAILEKLTAADAARQDPGGVGRLQLLNTLIKLGNVERTQADFKASTGHLTRALRIAEDGLYPTFWLHYALYELGLTQVRLRDFAGALTSLRRSVAAFESTQFANLDYREWLMRRGASGVYAELIRLLLQLNRPEQALEYLERAKSKALVDFLNLRSLQTKDEALTGLLRRFADLQCTLRAQEKSLTEERIKLADQQSAIKVEQLTHLLAETKKDFYKVVVDLRQRYGEKWASLVRVEPNEFAGLDRDLPEDAVVVEYCPFPDRLQILVVARGRYVVKEQEVSCADLNAWVEEVRDAMTGVPGRFSSPESPPALVRLYEHLIAPIGNELSNYKTVVIVPSGTLHYLPFGALARKEPDGRLHYVIERNQQFVKLTQLSLLKTLQRNSASSDERRTVSVLAFGNPAGIKPALPRAEEEVRTIARAYPGSRAFIGHEAAKWRVVMQAKYGRILHLATHGVLCHDDPNESYIALAASQGDNGKLTQGEVYGLELNGTRMVVLSACQTAVAEENPGREISSLAQAFAIAGAPTILATLWSVNDDSTARLMETFYQAVLKGQNKAQALQTAQRALLSNPKYSHPYYWAGFELFGTWE